MARKLIDLEEAAKIVGVTPDTLNEMRERREIFGLRDGASWKFKQEDLDRLVADRAAAEEEGEFAEIDEDPDSILLSEVELGGSEQGSPSTIIGGSSSRKSPQDSDIQLAGPEPEELKLDADRQDSDLDLDAALASDSGGSDVLSTGSGVSPMFDELDTLDLEMPSAADSGISSAAPPKATSVPTGSSILGLAGDSGIAPAAPEPKSASGMQAMMGGDEELVLGEASPSDILDGSKAGSRGGGSAIDLTEDLDDDLVLGGSAPGDVSRTGDSGISLLDPSDSGLNLESAPLDLGGSTAEPLSLGEDELLVDEPAVKAGSAVESQSDDDFLLTPLEEAAADESDSGSQVIALEGEVEFDAVGDDMGGFDAPGGSAGLLEEDLGEGLGATAAFGTATMTPGGPMAAAGAAVAPATPTVPDAVFTGPNVLSLALCALMLMIGGMFMYDLMRNMWSWNAPYSINSSMVAGILSWFE